MEAASERSDLRIVLYTGMDGLKELEDAWGRLHSAMRHPAYYHDWRWVMTVQMYLEQPPLHFVVGYRGGNAVIILPLRVRSKSAAGMRLVFFDFPYKADALVDLDRLEPGDFKAMLAYFERQKGLKWDYAFLAELTETAALCDLLSSSGIRLEPYSTNAYFELTDGELGSTVSKKMVKNINRLSRKLETDVGPIRITLTQDPAELYPAYEVFLDLEASGWKGEGGTSSAIRNDEQKEKFWKAVIDRFSSDGLFQINLLEVNGTPAAGQMCIRHGAVWYILKIGYNEDMRQYGVGNILMLAFLEKVSAQGGISEVNLVSAAEWAERWHPSRRQVYSSTFFNSSMKGRMLQGMRYLKSMLNRSKSTGTALH